MVRNIVGMLGACLLAASAWAAGGEAQQQQQQMGQQQGGQQVSGEVVKVEKKNLYLREASGAIVPLKMDDNTSFEGEFTRESLKEGTQVQASFTIEGETTNLATSISEAGTGGAGEEVFEEEEVIEEQPEEQPMEEPGTGGAGQQQQEELEY